MVNHGHDGQFVLANFFGQNGLILFKLVHAMQYITFSKKQTYRLLF